MLSNKTRRREGSHTFLRPIICNCILFVFESTKAAAPHWPIPNDTLVCLSRSTFLAFRISDGLCRLFKIGGSFEAWVLVFLRPLGLGYVGITIDDVVMFQGLSSLEHDQVYGLIQGRNVFLD